MVHDRTGWRVSRGALNAAKVADGALRLATIAPPDRSQVLLVSTYYP
jgi:hypothetical protein